MTGQEVTADSAVSHRNDQIIVKQKANARLMC